MGNKRVKLELNPDTIKGIAVRRARGISLNDLEKEFAVSRPVITRALATDEARQIMLDILRDDVALENAQTRKAAAELGPMAIELLRKKLLDGDLKAVEPALRASGIYVQNAQAKDDNKQAQILQVILPGDVAPKEIEVANEQYVQEG